MELWKKLLKSPRINSKSCTKELVSHGGLYDRNILWHPQKRNFSKDKYHSTQLQDYVDYVLFTDEKNYKLSNYVKLYEVM